MRINGVFVHDIANEGVDRAIGTPINDIAHFLNKLTVAESVERPETLRARNACGVNYVQGHYVGRPGSGIPTRGAANYIPEPSGAVRNGKYQ